MSIVFRLNCVIDLYNFYLLPNYTKSILSKGTCDFHPSFIDIPILYNDIMKPRIV